MLRSRFWYVYPSGDKIAVLLNVNRFKSSLLIRKYIGHGFTSLRTATRESTDASPLIDCSNSRGIGELRNIYALPLDAYKYYYEYKSIGGSPAQVDMATSIHHTHPVIWIRLVLRISRMFNKKVNMLSRGWESYFLYRGDLPVMSPITALTLQYKKAKWMFLKLVQICHEFTQHFTEGYGCSTSKWETQHTSPTTLPYLGNIILESR